MIWTPARSTTTPLHSLMMGKSRRIVEKENPFFSQTDNISRQHKANDLECSRAVHQPIASNKNAFTSRCTVASTSTVTPQYVRLPTDR